MDTLKTQESIFIFCWNEPAEFSKYELKREFFFYLRRYYIKLFLISLIAVLLALFAAIPHWNKNTIYWALLFLGAWWILIIWINYNVYRSIYKRGRMIVVDDVAIRCGMFVIFDLNKITDVKKEFIRIENKNFPCISFDFARKKFYVGLELKNEEEVQDNLHNLWMRLNKQKTTISSC